MRLAPSLISSVFGSLPLASNSQDSSLLPETLLNLRVPSFFLPVCLTLAKSSLFS